jgi:choline/glycine/proline betaine transport protein
LLSMRGLLKALKLDATKRGLRHQALAISPSTPRAGGNWQRRLRTLAMFPRRAHVVRFIEEVARPACLSVAEEWRLQGYDCTVEDGEEGGVRLSVGPTDDAFIYEIRPHAYATPSFVMSGPTGEERKYFRAEVHLREGGQDHDVMGWSRDEVIGDILDHYERHMHFLHLVG